MNTLASAVPFGLSRRQLLTGSAAIGLLGAVPRRVWADTPDLKGASIRAAYYKGQELLSLTAAGLTDTPYKVAYSEFGSGNLIIQAINAGAIDVGGMSEIPPVFAATAGSGVELKLIAIARGDVNNQVVLVPKESPARSIGDLKGKRVGYVRATTSHYYLIKMLREQGLTFSDIQPINLSPADGLAAFESGALDAWAIYGYSIQLAIAAVGARVLKTALGYLSGNYVVGVHPSVLTDPLKHAVVADYLRRLQKAYRWREDNKDQWTEILSKAIQVSRSIVHEQLYNESQPYRLAPVDDAAIQSQQAVADTFADAQLIPSPVNVAPLWDRSFNDVLSEAS